MFSQCRFSVWVRNKVSETDNVTVVLVCEKFVTELYTDKKLERAYTLTQGFLKLGLGCRYSSALEHLINSFKDLGSVPSTYLKAVRELAAYLPVCLPVLQLRSINKQKTLSLDFF